MLVIKPGSMLKHIGSRKKKIIKSLPENWFEKYTSFQAELGLKLLSTIQNTDQVRIQNVEYLKSSMHSVVYPNGVDDTNNVYWQLVVFFKNPIDTQKLMHKMGVDTSTTSLEKISSLGGYPYYGETPNADYLHSNGLFIPSFPGLSMKDLYRISHVANHSVSK
jgi:perosamine synthetase